jgi:hypothetical protein
VDDTVGLGSAPQLVEHGVEIIQLGIEGSIEVVLGGEHAAARDEWPTMRSSARSSESIEDGGLTLVRALYPAPHLVALDDLASSRDEITRA